jgi:transposase InsO family protein
MVAERKCSERLACRLIRLPRSTAQYRARTKAEELALVERLKTFARGHRRRGYRLVYHLLKKEGQAVNHKRIYRLWRREGLCVPPRKKRKRLRGMSPARRLEATCPDSVWCLDFVEGRTLKGTKLRILSMTDEFTRESLALCVGVSFVSERVCQTLEEVVVCRGGVPGALRMDNGPEFIALALRGWCHRKAVNAAYITPGKPWENGYAESFHSRLRDEFLDGEVFVSLRDAQVRLGGFRRYWNAERLHSSLGYLTPLDFAQRWRDEEEAARESLGMAGKAKDETGT